MAWRARHFHKAEYLPLLSLSIKLVCATIITILRIFVCFQCRHEGIIKLIGPGAGLCRGWEQLIPAQDNIGHANQLLWRIENEAATVMPFMFVHLLTEQVRENERQKQQQVVVVAGKRFSCCFLFLLQLRKYIGGCLVDRNQTHMCTIQQMTAHCVFLAGQHVQSVCQFLGGQSSQA